MSEVKCEARVDLNLRQRLEDIGPLLRGEEVEGLGTFEEYGLSLDYVAPETFNQQAEGYFRYQISWGGPSDEFRFFVNPDLLCHRIEYWFLDWFDGAHRDCSTDAVARALWDYFAGTGAAQHALRDAER